MSAVAVGGDATPALCPRCGGGFVCGANNSNAEAPCACAGLQLSAALLQRLRAQYPAGCLCLDCLVALQQPHLHKPQVQAAAST